MDALATDPAILESELLALLDGPEDAATAMSSFVTEPSPLHTFPLSHQAQHMLSSQRDATPSSDCDQELFSLLATCSNISSLSNAIDDTMSTASSSGSEAPEPRATKRPRVASKRKPTYYARKVRPCVAQWHCIQQAGALTLTLSRAS